MMRVLILLLTPMFYGKLGEPSRHSDSIRSYLFHELIENLSLVSTISSIRWIETIQKLKAFSLFERIICWG
ncbi:hypothetical protein BY996DRAFT_2427951 [Phakopsora pachyrhizi]|nr:hypothetical protein BY996DRAFT_2427951 [Phakopsora pachyrhizi]